jgi:hypothetical protein
MIDGRPRIGARWPIVAAVVVVLLLAVAIGAYQSGAPAAGQPAPTSQPQAQSQPAAHAPSPATAARTPAAVATAQIASQGASARTPAPTATARIAAPAARPPAKPASTASVAGPSGSVDVDREQIARDATWAPGQLQAHFEKHGREGPWASEADFDASARETIRIGTVFTYVDQTSHAERLGFYDRGSNRFASVTRDGRRITTQFKPDRGEAYVRGLAQSTYR